MLISAWAARTALGEYQHAEETLRQGVTIFPQPCPASLLGDDTVHCAKAQGGDGTRVEEPDGDHLRREVSILQAAYRVLCGTP